MTSHCRLHCRVLTPSCSWRRGWQTRGGKHAAENARCNARSDTGVCSHERGFKPASPPPPVMCMCRSTKPGVMTQPLAARTWMSSGRSRIALASASDRMPMMLPPADSCEATLRLRWAGPQACLTARLVQLSVVAHANRAQVPDALRTSSCAMPPAAPAQAHYRDSKCHSLVSTEMLTHPQEADCDLSVAPGKAPTLRRAPASDAPPTCLHSPWWPDDDRRCFTEGLINHMFLDILIGAVSAD